MTHRRYGKKPARLNSIVLRLKTYLDQSVLPAIPDDFGHEGLVTDWPMLGNDSVGDCVWAGAAHETMLWCAETATDVGFTDAAVLSDYTAVTGYDPSLTDAATGDNPSDQGTDVQQAAAYRQKTGIADAAGNRHRIGAYVALTPGDPTELAAAAYLFSAVGVGLRVPDFAEDQFDSRETWSTRGQYGAPNIVGGHYVPVLGRIGGLFHVVTWGRVQTMDEMFYRQFCDEAIVYLSPEFLRAGHSPEGFDVAALQADLKAFMRP